MADSRGKPASLNKAIRENVTLNKAIKEALASYSRQTRSELVVEAVDKAIDTPLQQINDKQYYDLPKRFQFLNYAANHRPRVPQELLHLPIPENDERSRPAICNNCKDNFLGRVHYWLRVQEMNQFKCFHDSPIFGENIVLQRHSMNSESNIAEQQLNSLQVLFGFMEKNYYDFDSVDI